MNHQPFESWLLDDRVLATDETRELHEHLQSCVYCTALRDSGIQLRAARAVPPGNGFMLRFQGRLAAQHAADKRRRRQGWVVLALAGVALLGWLAGPVVIAMVRAPAEWLTVWIGYLLFLLTSFRVLFEFGQVFVRVAPGLVPTYVWMVVTSGFAGFALLWSVSIWRLARVRQGV